MKVTFMPTVIGALGTPIEGLEKVQEEIRKKNRTSGDHPNDNIIEIGQNTEKSPRDLRRLVVTQTSVGDH